jgi:hypothetical protein
LIDLDTHREVFSWVLGMLADHGLVKGQRIAIDATTLEANAAMRSIVRRDTGESYEEFLGLLWYGNGQQRFRSSRISAPFAKSVVRSRTRLRRLCSKLAICTTGC